LDIEIRKERLEEYKMVENIVRESFWNVYRPGCNEHLILHNFRNHENYIDELSSVVLVDDKIVGQIMFSKAELTNIRNGEKHDIIVFGPVSILPECQRQGIGEKLIRDAISKARDLDYSYIIIFGNPNYYHRFGFKTAQDYGVIIEGQDFLEELDYVMVLDLQHDGIISKESGPWLYKDPEGYKTNDSDLEEFDKNFEFKIKKVNENQLS